MKRWVLILVLFIGSFCFAETLKTGDMCYVSLDGSFDEIKPIRGIYPVAAQNSKVYYVLEQDEYKYTVEKGSEMYIYLTEKNDKGFFVPVEYKVKITDVGPNYISFTKEKVDD